MNFAMTVVDRAQRKWSRRFDAFRHSLIYVAASALIAACSGCSTGGFPVNGKVVDAETNQPIPNVWVVQEWRSRDRFAIPFSWDRIRTFSCREGRFAKTDAQGNFRFDAPTTIEVSFLKEPYAVFDALMLGFVADPARSEEAVSEWNAAGPKATVVMRRTALSDEQIEGLAFGQMVAGGRCGFRPVPDELRIEMASFLRSRGITRSKLIDRLVKQYSKTFSRPVTESEMLSWENFRDQRKALEVLEQTP